MELLRNSCRGVHSHSNGEKTFSFEGNVTMTLKLDQLEEWKGVGWDWVQGRAEASSELFCRRDPDVRA